MLLKRSIVHFYKLLCTLHPHSTCTHQVFVEKNYMYMLLVMGNMIPEALDYKLHCTLIEYLHVHVFWN